MGVWLLLFRGGVVLEWVRQVVEYVGYLERENFHVLCIEICTYGRSRVDDC